MKILLINTGYIDIANQLVAKAKARFLKKVVLVSRDRYSLTKYQDKLRLLDYSGIFYDDKKTPLEIETDLMESLRDEYRRLIAGSGDIFLVIGCETAEIAALKVIQSVCHETNTRFHVLFIAPFLFEGQKRSQLLRSMMMSMSEYYDSVSLYYPDELLRIQNAENANNPNKKGRALDIHQAYDALEEEAANLLLELGKQIPKLNILMQYTYDFELKEFSLAVDPLMLLLNMWGSVSSDEDNFHTTDKNGMEAEISLDSEGEELSDEDVTEFPEIGILAPDRDEKNKVSAYRNVSLNSIPVGIYRKQVGDSALDRLVEGIKDILRAESSGTVDIEKRKKAQERLKQEIVKFQVRQAEARELYRGEQPTAIRGMDEALMDIYMSDGERDQESEMGDGEGKAYMETPFQRAVRAVQNKEKSTSWVHIKADRDAATIPSPISNDEINISDTNEPDISDAPPVQPTVAGVPLGINVFTSGLDEGNGHLGNRSVHAETFSERLKKQGSNFKSSNIGAKKNHSADDLDRMRKVIKRKKTGENIEDQIELQDKDVNNDSSNSMNVDNAHSTLSDLARQGSSMGRSPVDPNSKNDVQVENKSNITRSPLDPGVKSQARFLDKKDVNDNEDKAKDDEHVRTNSIIDELENSGHSLSDEERALLRKKLAKAEEKAAAAKAKAEAALREASEAAKQVEIIARAHDEENEK